MLIPATSLYRVPNVCFDAQLVYTNNTYCQAMRGYGNPEVTWAIESTSTSWRRRPASTRSSCGCSTATQPGETTPMGLEITTCGLGECLEFAEKSLDWTEKRGKQREQAPRRRRGLADPRRRLGSHLPLRRRRRHPEARRLRQRQRLLRRRRDGPGPALGADPRRWPRRSACCPTRSSSTRPTPRPAPGTWAPTPAAAPSWRCNAAIRAADKARKKIFALAPRSLRRRGRRRASLRTRRRTRRISRRPSTLPPQPEPTTSSSRLAFLFPKDAPDEPWLRIELGRLLRALHFRGGRADDHRRGVLRAAERAARLGQGRRQHVRDLRLRRAGRRGRGRRRDRRREDPEGGLGPRRRAAC